MEAAANTSDGPHEDTTRSKTYTQNASQARKVTELELDITESCTDDMDVTIYVVELSSSLLLLRAVVRGQSRHSDNNKSDYMLHKNKQNTPDTNYLPKHFA